MQEHPPPFEPLLKHPSQFLLAFGNEDGLTALLRLDQLIEGQRCRRLLRLQVRFRPHTGERSDLLVIIAGRHRVEDLVGERVQPVLNTFKRLNRGDEAHCAKFLLRNAKGSQPCVGHVVEEARR